MVLKGEEEERKKRKVKKKLVEIFELKKNAIK